MPIRPFAPRLPPFAWAVLAFLLLLVSLSGDSIDMMEAQTWAYARQEGLSGFLGLLHSDPTQVSQMPLGMFSAWLWSKGFGTGELAMRLLNLVWAAIALAALARVGRQFSIPWLPVLFAIQPFVWYYTNYARTPLMQIAGGALLLSGAAGFLPGGRKAGLDAALLCFGGVLLSGAHILGMLPLASVAGWMLMLGIWKKLRLSRGAKSLVFLCAALLGLLAAYYATTLLHGRPSAKYWAISPANVLFVAYEFLGLVGFGPGRQDLRAIMKGFTPPGELIAMLPGFLLFLAAYFVVFAAAARSWMTREAAPAALARPDHPKTLARSYALLSPWLMGVGVPALSTTTLFLTSLVLGQPFWGRELAGTFPFWILSLAITIHWARQGIWRKAGRLASAAVLLGLLGSSLALRFAPWHRHDDYRGGAAEARRIAADGGTVWWVADIGAGTYYGLPLSGVTDGNDRIFPGQPPTPPSAVIINRRDIFDPGEAASRLVRDGGYKQTRSLRAFEVWEKPREP